MRDVSVVASQIPPFIAAAASAVLMVSLGACSSGGAKPSELTLPNRSEVARPSQSPSLVRPDSSLPALPLDAYKKSPQDFFVLRRAERILVNQCMVGFGFKAVSLRGSLEETQAQFANIRARLYGVSDLETVKKYGYAPPPQVVSANAAPVEPTAAEMQVMLGKVSPDPSSAEVKRYQGKEIPKGGCVGQARVAIAGTASDEEQFGLASGLSVEAGVATQSDPRTLQINSEWSSCMKKSGYSVQDPMTSDAEFIRAPNTKPSQNELRAAISDVGCKNKVKLIDRWHAVNEDLENKLIEKNQLALTEERKRLSAAVAHATKIVGDQPS